MQARQYLLPAAPAETADANLLALKTHALKVLLGLKISRGNRNKNSNFRFPPRSYCEQELGVPQTAYRANNGRAARFDASQKVGKGVLVLGRKVGHVHGLAIEPVWHRHIKA